MREKLNINECNYILSYNSLYIHNKSYKGLTLNNFLAQLWRFNAEGHLENKLQGWRYSDSKAAIDPKGAQEGFIEIEDIDKVLSLIDEITMEVGYEIKNVSQTANQMWNLTKEQKDGWRNIIHSKGGLYLTARPRNIGSVLRLENKGIYIIIDNPEHNYYGQLGC